MWNFRTLFRMGRLIYLSWVTSNLPSGIGAAGKEANALARLPLATEGLLASFMFVK